MDGDVLLRRKIHYGPFLGMSIMVWGGDLLTAQGQVENAGQVNTRPLSRDPLDPFFPPMKLLPHKTSASHLPAHRQLFPLESGSVSEQSITDIGTMSLPDDAILPSHIGAWGNTPPRLMEANPLGFLIVEEIFLNALLNTWFYTGEDSCLIKCGGR